MSILSPNMNLPISTIGVDSGLNWELNLNSGLSLIDLHDHTPGKGVALTPTSLNINADFPFNNNNLTFAKSVRFQSQPSALSGVSDLGCLYESGVDLYYNDGSGNQIRLTQAGSIVGAAGTIAGLPSGTASAAFAAGVFTFQAATATGANIDGASFIFRNNTANSHGLTLSPPNAMAADYSLILPALPGATSFLTLDTSGNISTISLLGMLTTSNLSASAGIVGSQLSASAGILGSQLANLTITGAKLAPAAVDTGNIVPLAITTGLIGVGQVSKTRLSAAVFGHNANSGSACLNTTSSIPVTLSGSGRPVIITINVYGTSTNFGTVTSSRTLRLKVNGSPLYTLYTGNNTTTEQPVISGTYLDPNGNNGSLTYDIVTDSGTAGIATGTIELVAWEL